MKEPKRMTAAEILAELVDGSRDWTLKLIADVKGDEWTFQGAAGGQHVLWLCGHLAVAEHLLVLARCLGEEAPDAEFAGHFPIGGPVKSADRHDYPSPASVLERMARTHEAVVKAIRGMSDTVLAQVCYGKDGAVHPHYATKAGAIGHCARHEGFHAGQIAMLRGMMGKAFLR